MAQEKEVSICIDKCPGQSEDVKTETGGKYYYMDETCKDERINITVRMNSKKFPGYKKLVHRPESQHAKIIKIVSEEYPLEEFDYSLKNCKSVSVYYWTGDSEYIFPLVLQLNEKGKRDYYAWDDGNLWRPLSINETSNRLLKNLDEQNCEHNQVHVIDISHKGNGHYCCYACVDQVQIPITIENLEGYKKVTHEPDDSCIGRLKNGSGNITGIPILEGTAALEVYWYHLQGDEKALLIHPLVSTDKGRSSSKDLWYYRSSSDEKKWSKVGDKVPKGPDEILKLLQTINSGGMTDASPEPPPKKVETPNPEQKIPTTTDQQSLSSDTDDEPYYPTERVHTSQVNEKQNRDTQVVENVTEQVKTYPQLAGAHPLYSAEHVPTSSKRTAPVVHTNSGRQENGLHRDYPRGSREHPKPMKEFSVGTIAAMAIVGIIGVGFVCFVALKIVPVIRSSSAKSPSSV